LYGWYCLILRNLLYRVGDICKEKTELRKEINQLKKQRAILFYIVVITGTE
jgi:hypothetical protein